MPAEVGLTRDADVGQDGLLPVLDAAYLREVHVKGQVEQAGEEGEHAHGHAVAAGVGVAVVDAELLAFRGAVEVALIHDGAEHHDGEDLQRPGGAGVAVRPGEAPPRTSPGRWGQGCLPLCEPSSPQTVTGLG